MKSLIVASVVFLLVFGIVYLGSLVIGLLGSLRVPSIFLGVLAALVAYYKIEKNW